MQSVHLRVTDAGTGKSTPVRLRITDAEGRTYAPLGRLTEFDADPRRDGGGNVLVDGRAYAHIDGGCEILLPPGKLHVEIHKGPEYLPLEQDFELIPGKLSLRWTLARRVDLRAEGWYAGDLRSHYLSPRAALLEAQAEDLAFVHVLIRAADGALPNILDFSGSEPALRTPDHVVTYDTFNESPLGRLGLLDCHRVVYPLAVREPIDWNLADWCGQCHRKRGLVVWSGWDEDLANAEPGEGLANLLLGGIDALEVHPGNFDQGALNLWYRLLDAGLHVPLVGCSAKDSTTLPLGSLRTYAHLGSKDTLELADWIAALRAGRTCVTRGPLLRLGVDGTGAGEVSNLDQPHPVRMRVRWEGGAINGRLQVVGAGGAVVFEANTQPNQVLEVMTEIPLAETTWLAARCVENGRILAHTAPVQVVVAGQPQRPDAAAAAFVRDRFEALCRQVDGLERRGGFASARDAARLREVLAEARGKLDATIRS